MPSQPSAETKSQELLDRIVDSFQIRMLWKDKDSRYIDCNQAFAEDAGFSCPAEVIGKTEFDMPWKHDDADYHLQTDRAVMESGEPILSFEQELSHADHRKSWILTSKVPTRDSDGKVNGILVMYQDMTYIRNLDKSRYLVNRAYQLLRDTNRAIIASNNETTLYGNICQLIVKHGYRMAWIGQLGAGPEKRIEPLSSAGLDGGYLKSIQVTWADNPLGHGPTGTAAREARTVINQNFLTNPAMLPWRESAIQHGYQSSIALPLKSEASQVFAVVTIYAAEPNAFDEDETEKLEEMAQALSFGHGAILERQKRFHVLEKSVAALAAAVESRDPYTAGHQSRVADLVWAMAQDMGLDADTCTGIKLAGLIHDIGKMQVPIELLTKPTALNDLEIAMMRMHPEVGYNIIKDIPFPWPIADMIRQHHERLDGSGYPHGLSGKDILIGAKILAVADVVEAMSSHRPYRPAKGMAAAIAEIKNQRGKTLDPAAVDSCLRLLQDPRHPLASASGLQNLLTDSS